MTQAEVAHMGKTATKGMVLITDRVWRKAFMEYNCAQVGKYSRLAMTCAKCYPKVLRFHQHKGFTA